MLFRVQTFRPLRALLSKPKSLQRLAARGGSMSIKISERSIFSSGGIEEVVISSKNHYLAISSSSIAAEASGSITFSPDSLYELIQILQQFDNERGEA